MARLSTYSPARRHGGAARVPFHPPRCSANPTRNLFLEPNALEPSVSAAVPRPTPTARRASATNCMPPTPTRHVRSLPEAPNTLMMEAEMPTTSN